MDSLPSGRSNFALHRTEVNGVINGVRQRFPILTPVRAQVSVPVDQSLGKGPSSLRGPLPSSCRKEWGTQNQKSVPVPVSDRLNACRKNAVADPSTSVDIRWTACQRSQHGKIRLRLGSLNNVRQKKPLTRIRKMQIKVFTFSKPYMSMWKIPAEKVEQEVQNWLAKNPGIKVREIKHDTIQGIWVSPQLIITIYYLNSGELE